MRSQPKEKGEREKDLLLSPLCPGQKVHLTVPDWLQAGLAGQQCEEEEEDEEIDLLVFVPGSSTSLP